MRSKIKFNKVDIVAELEDKACAQMSELSERGAKIGVACSGGADSVFALYLVADVFAGNLANVYVLHYNHKVRADSDKDEKYVADLCAQLGVNFVRGEPKVAPTSPTEDELRNLRLDFFVRQSKDLGLGAIVQGHHCGDVLESMLMRLSRASSGDGLCAPRPVSYYKGAVFLRPLLNTKKDDIVSALVSAKIVWCEDYTNGESDFFRNRIRNNVIPIFSESSPTDVFKAVARSRALLEEDADAITSLFEREYLKLNELSIDTTKCNLSELLVSAKAFARRSVVKFLAENKVSVRSGAVDGFVEKIVSGKDFRSSAGQTDDGQKVFICFDSQELTLKLQVERKTFEYNIPLKIGKNDLPDGSSISIAKISLTKTRRESIKSGDNDDCTTAYLDLDCVGTFENYALVVRTKQDGDKYTPLGAKSPKKIKDIYNAKKVPQMKRNAFPLVCNKKGEILWSPMLPPSEKYKIKNGGAALELTFSQSRY